MRPFAMVFCVTFATALLAQTPQPSQAQPPTQVRMMGYFAGDWTLSGTTKIGPKAPPAPFHAAEHAEWVPGGYFLEAKTVMHGPMGDVHSVRMMEWVSKDNAYTYNSYNSLGEHTVAIGTAEGDTWVWNAQEKLNGVATRGRYIVTLTSPASYTFKSQVGKPGGGWDTVMEGKATRVQQAQ